MKLRKLAVIAAMLPLGTLAQLSVHEVQDPTNRGSSQPRLVEAKTFGYVKPASMLKLTQSRIATPFVTSIEAPTNERTKKGTPAKVSSVSELQGTYIMTYSSLVASAGNGGVGVTIVPLGTDSIVINNFFESGMNVHAKVNLAQGTLSIPCQYVGTNTTYGPMDLAVCNSSGKPDRSQEIQGTINSDGTLSIATWWGIFVGQNGGQYDDALFSAYYNTQFERSNGTMGDTTYAGGSHSYPVTVTQKSVNVVAVKNFGNHGQTVEIELNRVRSGIIRTQMVWDYVANNSPNPFYSVGITSFNDSTGAPATMTPDRSITLDTVAAGPCRKLSWGPWTALATGYYLGALTSGWVETNFDITFPELSVTEFSGSGTEADPYIISSLDHLVLLSDKVNSDNEYNWTYYNNTYARSYLGKYFKITADIDMNNYRFTPIGNNFRQIFAGQIDGGGHTIKNLSVNSGSTGYAGLFGRLDTVSVVKNLILDSPTVETTGLYGGGLCAWSLGELRNIQVKNPNITVTTYAAGALAGIAWNVYDCNVTGGKVMANGYTGSLCGEVDNYIENCWGDGTSVMAGAYANNYPSGGLIGSLPYATAKNLWFAGTVDGYTLPKSQNTSPNVGGLTGALGGAKLSNSFFVGTVMGYGTEGYVGGLIGRLQGSTVENCFSRGRVASYYSRNTGGISGHVQFYVNQGDTIPTVVKNVYTATTITAETYQYDPVNTNVETLGTGANEVKPQVENLYYDRQLFDMKSENYSKGLLTKEITATNGPSGFDSNIWSIKEGFYPVIKETASTSAAQWASSALQMTTNNSINFVSSPAEIKSGGTTDFGFYMDGYLKKTGHYATISGNTLQPNGKGAGQDTLMIVNNGKNFYYILDVVSMQLEGTGEESSPYLIQTPSDLIWLSKVTTEGGILFPNSYFKITNDIDFGYDSGFLGICSNHKDASNKFAGVIDGGGYTISKMKFATVDWTTRPTETAMGTASTADTKAYKGFIGRLGEYGVLKNINFAADCDLEYWATSGAAVGYNYGTIDNVRNYADVVGASCWIGGITGYNLKGGIITNCYNAGNVTTSYNCVGGIAGTNYGNIENSTNVGDIKAYKWVTNFKTQNMAGGITGSSNNGIFRNCANYGAIYGEQNQAGGISGSLPVGNGSTGNGYNDVNGALNVGVVNTADFATIGSIAGLATTAAGPSEGEIKGVYYDQQIVPYPPIGNKEVAGITGLNTSTLTSGQSIEGLDASIWQFDAGMYPVLKQYANEPKLKEARKLLLTLPDGSTVLSLNAKGASSGDLSTGEGMSWSYSGNQEMKIEGNKFMFPANVSKIISGILTGVNGTFTKEIGVTCAPPVPLEGNGTEASPYLITSADDWNALSAYVNSVGNSFEGKYLRITKDISFSGKTFSPLFCDNVTYLQGTLDGDGHTVSGIVYTTTANYQGPIGILGENGTIKNLTLAGQVNNSAYTYAAGFTGKVYGKLEKVTNRVNVNSTKGSGVSGFGYLYTGATLTDVVNKGAMSGISTYVAGIASNAAEGVEFTRVSNEGKISTTVSSSTTTGTAVNVAGLVAYSYPNKYIDCYNIGEIELTGTNVYRVGGLIAYVNATAAGADSLIMQGCYNTADISASWMVGGLLGEMNASTTIINKIIMDRCYNTGTITSTGVTTGTSAKSPGAAGLGTHYTPGSVITNCWNSGFISNSISGQVGNTYASGLFTYYKATPTVDLPVIVKNCFNTGEINNTGNQVGGIIAYMTAYTTIDSCWNSADITGGFGIGGIAACLGNLNSKITNCWNSGIISSNANRVGGIVGYNGNAATTSDCFNVGNIINTGEITTATNGNVTNGYGTGGIAGQAGVVNRCYNLARVTGKCRVGGLVGYPIKNTSKIQNSYFAGSLSAPADTAGTIYGINPTNNGSLWTETNEITNCYYVDPAEASVWKWGTPITRAELASTDSKLGEGWNYADQYTFPMLIANMPDIAKVYAAQVITRDNEPLDMITKNFYVGLPEGVEWTTNNPELTRDGNKFAWSTKGYNGDFKLTASLGTYSNIWSLKANVASGVESTDAPAIISEMYFTTDGMRVQVPEINSGKFYVVVRIYADGSKKTTVEKL